LFVAVPVRADLEPVVDSKAENWQKVFTATYTNDSLGQWNWDGTPVVGYENVLAVDGGVMSLREGKHHRIAAALGSEFNAGDLVAVKLTAFGRSEENTFESFIRGMTITNITVAPESGDLSEAPSFSGSGWTRSAEAGTPGETGNSGTLPLEQYVYGIEDFLSEVDTGELEFRFDRNMVGGYVGYFLEFYVQENPSANVPEPATIAILGLGLVSIGVLGNRKRNRK
jgi:hypothetical protein